MLKNLFLLSHIPNITIPGNNGKPYLTRWWLFWKDRAFGNIFLHKFHQSDLDTDPEDGSLLLHSHKWISLSFIVYGGYIEERRNPDNSISVKTVKPFRFNYLPANTIHRVELLKDAAWTIFITGKRDKNNDWYFWNRTTFKKIPWQTKPGAIA
jgi:hypothetical protein